MELITPAPGLFIWLAVIIAMATGLNILLKKKTNINRSVRLFLSIGLVLAMILLITGSLASPLLTR